MDMFDRRLSSSTTKSSMRRVTGLMLSELAFPTLTKMVFVSRQTRRLRTPYRCHSFSNANSSRWTRSRGMQKHSSSVTGFRRKKRANHDRSGPEACGESMLDGFENSDVKDGLVSIVVSVKKTCEYPHTRCQI